MKKETVYNHLEKITLDTVNRGIKTFIIGEGKGKYYCHELGELTQWAKVTGQEQYKAHRLNPTVKYGNQYGRFWRPKGYATVEQAKDRINEIANSAIQYF